MTFSFPRDLFGAVAFRPYVHQSQVFVCVHLLYNYVRQQHMFCYNSFGNHVRILHKALLIISVF